MARECSLGRLVVRVKVRRRHLLLDVLDRPFGFANARLELGDPLGERLVGAFPLPTLDVGLPPLLARLRSRRRPPGRSRALARQALVFARLNL